MYQHRQMTLPLLLSVYYRYYRSGPSTGYRNIRTSGYPFYCTGTVYFALVVDPRDHPLDLWDGIPPGISSRRWLTAALGRPQKCHRKVPGRSQQESADDGCGPAGETKLFKNIVLAHALFRLLMISASIQKL